MSSTQETGFIIWSPYSGETALLLALFLFLMGGAVFVLGIRLKRGIRLPVVWNWLKVIIVIVWILQILILLKIFKHIATVDPSAGVTGPVLPITLASAGCTFAFVVYALRRDGARVSLGGAFAAAIAGPMIFELPFILIVGPVGSTPTDPGAALTIPFFIAMITTIAFLAFSSRAAITRYSLCCFAGMLLVLGIWALLGFAYPSDPTLLVLNSTSKVLGFATTATMFVKDKN